MPLKQEHVELDLDSLYQITNDQQQESSNQQDRVSFADNKSRFTKIGFDLYRDSDSQFIWKLEKDSETGEEYIMRTGSVDPLYRTASGWIAAVDSNKQGITLVYKGHSIKLFKKADLNFNEENIDQWRRFLLDKIVEDPSFVKNVVSELSDQRKKFILGKCPELQ